MFVALASSNITRDDSRGISKITYHDYLDLPSTIKIGGRENYHRYRPDGIKSYRQDRHSVMTTVASVDSLGNTIYTQKPTTKVTTRNYIGDFIKTGNYTWEVPTDDGHIFIDTRNKIKTHYYYVRDYLGSTRAVVDTAGMLLQTMNYYPSGVPFSRMEQEPITDRLHTGKPFLDMSGLGYYDNNARFLDILTGGFISRDALAGSYPHISPYANCANNPLIYIDPTGNDVWQIDNHGYIVNAEENTEYDKLEMVGDKDNSITFKYGTIISQKSYEYEKDKTYDIWKVRGDENATKMFEFMSDNISGSDSKVEIGLTQTGIAGDKGLNFITTGHKRGSEPGLTYLYVNQIQYKYNLRAITHSHPNSPDIFKDDKSFADVIYSNQKSNNLYLPSFFIYHVPTKTYQKYYPEK